MIIPISIIMPVCIVNFVLLALQYWRINPNRRLLNRQMGLMFITIAVMVSRIVLPHVSSKVSVPSMVMLALAVFLLCLTLYLYRYLPRR